MQEEAVRSKLLEKPEVSDEELMEKMNQIMSAEMERQNKMGVASKKSTHNLKVPSFFRTQTTGDEWADLECRIHPLFNRSSTYCLTSE